MTTRPALTFSGIISGSYAYGRSAVRPAIVGTLIFAGISLLVDYVRSLSLLGETGDLLSFCTIGGVGISWLAMALREGVGAPNPGIGLEAGRRELMLTLSIIGFLFVIGIVAFLVGFLVFLVVMIIAAIGGGAFTGADVASAPIFETRDAFRTFLKDTDMGRTVAALGVGVFLLAVSFMFWLVLRLSPFAAGAIAQKRFVVLQAMSWTRYTDMALFLSGLSVIGSAVVGICLGRSAISVLPMPALVQGFVAHLLTCFCVLFIVGFVCTVYLRTVEVEKTA